MNQIPPPLPQAHHSLFDYLRLLALVLLWGTAFALLKVAVVEIPPSTVVMGRLWVGALMLLAWVQIRGHKMPHLLPSKNQPFDRRWKWFALLGVTGATIPFALISWGQQSIDSALTGILMAVMPLATVVLAHFFVAGEKMTYRKTTGFLLGFAGIAILMGPQILFELGGEAFFAQLAMIAAALFYAIQTIFARNMPPTRPSVSAAGLLLCAAIIITPFGVFDAINMPMPSAKALLMVLLMGIGATGLGGILMMAVIRDAGPSFLSLSNYLMPLVAVLVGVMIGESLGMNIWIALLVIISGLLLAGYKSKSH